MYDTTPTRSLLSPLQSGNVVEFMNAVMGIHNHYHSLIADLFSSHKLFYSALDKVWPYSQIDRGSEEVFIAFERGCGFVSL